MRHVSYLSLLFFCISTNMMQGMDCSHMVQNVDWNSMEQNFLDQLIPTQNRYCNSQQQPVADHLSSSSPFAQQFPPSTIIQNMDLDQQDCSFDIEEYLKPAKSLETASQQSTSPNFLDRLISNVSTQSKCYNQQQPEPRNLFISSSSSTRQFLENTSNFMDLTQQTLDSDTEEFFNSVNMPNPFKKIDALSQIGSHSKQQKNINYDSQQPPIESFETTTQKSISQNLLAVEDSTDFDQGYFSSIKQFSISSDEEDSTVSDQEFGNQETLISEQQPKKRQCLHSSQKRLNIPDGCFYTLECCQVCPKTHRALSLSSLAANYKVHLKKGKKITNPEQTRNYVLQHAKNPSKHLLYLIPCFACENCISYSVFSKPALKQNLSIHLSKKHKELLNQLSNSYIEENVKIFITKSKTPLKKSDTRKKLKKIYDAAAFKVLNNFDKIIESLKKRKGRTGFRSSDKEKSFISSDDEYSTADDQEIDYPESERKHVACNRKNRVNTKTLPASAYFTIICDYCSQKIKSRTKFGLISNFTRHLKSQHPENNFDIRQNNLQEVKQLLIFSINCPEPSCEKIIHKNRKDRLTQLLITHLLKSKRHQKNKEKYSKESIESYANENFESKLIPNPRFKC